VIGASPFHLVFPCLLPARYNIARLPLGWSKFLSSPVRVPIGSKTLLKKFYLQPITDRPFSALHYVDFLIWLGDCDARFD
jgi:hypothetical protein